LNVNPSQIRLGCSVRIIKISGGESMHAYE
jgi:hypothetical protein